MIYNLFISHCWRYPKDYENLVRLLDKAPNFEYKNYSVPKNNPIPNISRQELEQQIRPASCILIPAGVYATYSDGEYGIQTEIEIAKNMGKKIIAIDKWGAKKTSTVVHGAADKVVKWNTQSIIDAIKELNPPRPAEEGGSSWFIDLLKVGVGVAVGVVGYFLYKKR